MDQVKTCEWDELQIKGALTETHKLGTTYYVAYPPGKKTPCVIGDISLYTNRARGPCVWVCVCGGGVSVYPSVCLRLISGIFAGFSRLIFPADFQYCAAHFQVLRGWFLQCGRSIFCSSISRLRSWFCVAKRCKIRDHHAWVTEIVQFQAILE